MGPLKDLIKSNFPNFISGIALLFSWLGIVFVIQDLFYVSFGFILLAFVQNLQFETLIIECEGSGTE